MSRFYFAEARGIGPRRAASQEGGTPLTLSLKQNQLTNYEITTIIT